MRNIAPIAFYVSINSRGRATVDGGARIMPMSVSVAIINNPIPSGFQNLSVAFAMTVRDGEKRGTNRILRRKFRSSKPTF